MLNPWECSLCRAVLPWGLPFEVASVNNSFDGSGVSDPNALAYNTQKFRMPHKNSHPNDFLEMKNMSVFLGRVIEILNLPCLKIVCLSVS